eukprot:885480-Alexandrium_andersonii.AAC.1
MGVHLACASMEFGLEALAALKDDSTKTGFPQCLDLLGDEIAELVKLVQAPCAKPVADIKTAAKALFKKLGNEDAAGPRLKALAQAAEASSRIWIFSVLAAELIT